MINVFDRVTPAEVARSVDRLLPELLSKSGDPTPRIHNMAVHTILSMADCREVRLTKQFLFLYCGPLNKSRNITTNMILIQHTYLLNHKIKWKL
jgi:hypothetical protein